MTALFEAATGLIGSSVFLEASAEDGCRFLGDWFGQAERNIVVPVRIQHA